MKKAVVVGLFFVFMFCGTAFTENKAGLNKLGGIIGAPTGLSFSHNFTKLDQIDLTVGFYGRLGYGFSGTTGLDLALGYLRSVYEPNVGGAVCPLEIGGGISFQPTWFYTLSSFAYSNYAMTFYFDLRWEVFFPSVPKFNLFLDFSPGLGIYLKDSYNRVFFAPHGGIGLRANL